MPCLNRSKQAWWDRESISLRYAKFNGEVEAVARRLAEKITIPGIKAALGIYSSVYIKAKREGRSWTLIYDLEHIRKLEPVDIRAMLFIVNLGFSVTEAARWLGITEREVRVHYEEALRNLTEQWRIDESHN